MKAISFIILLLMCCGCKTYNIYMTESNHEPIQSVPERSGNRFTPQFHEADSLFRVIEKDSDEAMKKAYEQTKHLLKQRVKYETK